jgi:cytosine/adenosine deaminase-related metal-dependent hydrolase
MNITFVNARFAAGRIGSLRVSGARIAALDAAPEESDVVLDLQGGRLLPGLINAHDHLQLNHLPADESPRQHYSHVRDWIAEVDLRRRSDPRFAAGVSVARDERLLLGGIKNLLSGVTTVAHHDPFYPFLAHSDFPIAVVRNYGWSHSLYLDGAQRVAASYRSTPSEWPWILHAAEGLNQEAANEFDRLDELGCLKANTLLVHGIALDQAQRSRLLRAGSGLIWCPSSNLRLFGRTADVADLSAHDRVALGTDSRLSGARDLIDELRLAGELSGLGEDSLTDLATRVSADLLRLPDRGALRTGLRADLLVLKPGASVANASRSDVGLVMIEGVVRYGDAHNVLRAAPLAEWTNVLVDGTPKLLALRIAQQASASRAAEAGLEMPSLAGRAA